MSNEQMISEEDLLAYVDAQLEEDDMVRVESWLANHPEDAAKIHAYRLQNLQLQHHFPLENFQKIPDRLLETLDLPKQKTNRHARNWYSMAASIAFIFLGTLGGWFLHDVQKQPSLMQSASFVEQAIGAHTVFVSEVRHPVEVASDQQTHLVSWLSNRLGTHLSLPDLAQAGFSLVGGRLLSEVATPAAQFMYENTAGQRLTLYVRSAHQEDTSFRIMQKNGNTAFYWIDKQFAYAVTGPLEKAQLLKIAHVMYQDLSSTLLH